MAALDVVEEEKLSEKSRRIRENISEQKSIKIIEKTDLIYQVEEKVYWNAILVNTPLSLPHGIFCMQLAENGLLQKTNSW